MGLSIKDVDKGYAALLRGALSLRGEVKVGVDAVPHAPSGMLADDLGKLHEFGLGPPERSFLRAWVDDNETRIRQTIKNWTYKALKGKLPWNAALGRIGAYGVRSVRKRIHDGIEPELADVTVLRKGEFEFPGTPLIATGGLLEAIVYETNSPDGAVAGNSSAGAGWTDASGDA